MSSVAPGTGARALRARVEAAPQLVRAALATPLPEIPWAAARRIVTTGIGSSEAHARLLAHALETHAGLPSRFVPTSALAGAPPAGSAQDVLVAFSQGLSPNARFALAAHGAWRRLVLVTSAREDDPDARDAASKTALLRRLREAGATLVPLPGGDEAGTLLRVGGPLAGCALALRLAHDAARRAGRLDAARALAFDPARISQALDAARPRAAAAWDAAGGLSPAGPLALVAWGQHRELAGNLAAKIVEGWLAPPPPVLDLLALAHGPLQQLHALPTAFVALTRPRDPDARAEEEALRLLATDLDPTRHRLLRLEATLPSPFALLEHEQMMNELVLRGIEASAIDPLRWPLREPEPALYRHAPACAPSSAAGATSSDAACGATDATSVRRLDALTWPEVESLLARGCRTAVVALGATEQHGPHLALGADAWIAEALAERVCERMPEAVLAAVVPVGCSGEHLAFPGTLSLREETLGRVLDDLVGSLARHGFDEVLLVSAHGGNAAPLRALLPALRAGHPGVRVLADTDLGRLAALQRAASAAHGVSPAEAGHHAGEFETSIALGIRPGAVRREHLAAGVPSPEDDAQALFHPSLRANAPDGVVGDPRRADAARADAYLAAWADALVEAFRAERSRAKNESQTKGTKNA